MHDAPVRGRGACLQELIRRLAEDVITRYERVDRALAAAVAEMYVTGTSTRKVQRVAERMGVSRLSKDHVDVH